MFNSHCVFRGFVWSANEGGPLHHQRSRGANAGGDADASSELWVSTAHQLLVNRPMSGEYFLRSKPLFSKSTDFNLSPQEHLPRRDLLQLHQCAQRQHPGGEGRAREGAVNKGLFRALVAHVALRVFTHRCALVAP